MKANKSRTSRGTIATVAIVGGEWKKLTDEWPPLRRSGAIGVAALPTGKDYLLIRQGDPALYITQNGSASAARELGRGSHPIRVLATSPDGSRAITGDEAGEVRIWTLKRSGAEPAAMKTPIGKFEKIDVFNGRFSLECFAESVNLHDHKNNRDATVPIGIGAHPVKGAFRSNLNSDPELGKRLGVALTDEVTLFDGDLIVQVFEGGTQLYSKTVNKSWYAWHARRKPATGSGPPVKAERADYVWVDDGLPVGAKLPSTAFRADVPWNFIGKDDGPVLSGSKSAKLSAKGGQQNIFERVNPGLHVGKDDVLFAYVYIDPKDPPEQIMLQWHTRSWDHRAYWGADKLSLGSPVKRSIGALPGAGKWVRLEVKIDDVRILPGAVINGLALTQYGGTAYWDKIGINSATPQGSAGPASKPQKLTTKVQGPSKMTGLKGDFSFTLYREGVLIRDNKLDKEQKVFADRPPAEIKGPFKGLIEDSRSSFHEPVSEPIEIFDGAMTVQLFRVGFLVRENSSNKTWNFVGYRVIGSPNAVLRGRSRPALRLMF